MSSSAVPAEAKLCEHKSVEYDQSQGASFCIDCGIVLEENTIVSEVTFGESSTGAAMVYGSLVRAGQTRANMGGIGRRGNGQESREQTIYRARLRLQAIATALNLSQHYVDSAVRYYTLALSHGFTKGRRSANVAASCLYIVCRTEKSSQMLIDFADVLEVNVFKIGTTFLKLVRLLNLNLPIVDPSFYVSRFASMLEFGEKTQAVAVDALRLIQRMDRDWMKIGRRPSGICGACLLIAARMHNFRRSMKEVVHIVKIGEDTLRKRLNEFKATPSGDLTVDEFRNIWLDESMDPPAFTRARLKARKEKDSKALGDDNADYNEEYDEETNAKESQMADEMNKIVQDARAKFLDYKLPEDTFDVEVSNWTDMDDDEVNAMILNEEEVGAKAEVWMKENQEFLEERERKRKEAENDPTSAASRKKKKNYSGQKKSKPQELQPGATASESAKNLLNMKKLSKKINYNVLDSLFDPDAPRPVIEPGQISFIPTASHMATPAASEADLDADKDRGDESTLVVREVVEEPGDEDVSGKPALSTTKDGIATSKAAGNEDEEDEYEEDDEEADETTLGAQAAALGYSINNEDYIDDAYGDYNDMDDDF
ncbi:transcription factor TFIIIB subunit brf1 [Mycoemilia scoparia]|uniref:B-related factor 1 n=1 Tax=Mycoemilia scoparia TaxID=417184 RepID=A0A9W8A1F5_9FUNG|nr:transcription factor TFIIIB subunit brf1 [Mycoemilia scoparia]